MKAISVRVENGRITGEAPDGLPDGEFELSIVDDDDDLSDEELARIDEAIARGLDDVAHGRVRSASAFAAELLRAR